MAIDYVFFQNLALELLTDAGRPVSVKTTARTPVNPAEPWKTGDAIEVETLQATIGAFFDSDDVTKFEDLLVALTQGAGDSQRTNIQASSTQVWIPALGVPNGITVADTLVDGATEWEITGVELIGPGPLPIVYIVGVSR